VDEALFQQQLSNARWLLIEIKLERATQRLQRAL
jgi:hypothetical protein